MINENQDIELFSQIDAELIYIKNFIKHPDELYHNLVNEIPWKQEKLIIFGKEIDQPRLQCLLGDKNKPYTYSGIKRIPENMTKSLLEIHNDINKTAKEFDKNHKEFKSVLANYYKTGNNYIGSHSDNEKELEKDAMIFSITLLEDKTTPRYFDIFSKDKQEKVLRIPLDHGSLLIMGKNMQENYKHGVPKQLKIKTGRINLTYRVIKS